MHKSLIILSTIFALLTLSLPAAAQTIELNNPSFEDEPTASTTPIGWRDCGSPGETPPDTQPNATFKVNTKAKEGDTYIGMVTRDTDTWEAVGQMLTVPLEGNRCYDFSLSLARSASYLSRRKSDTAEIQFIQPIRLRIWGGSRYCDRKELLAETEVVEHTQWKEYDFTLSPVRAYQFIMLEAFYMTPALVAYNGNLLVDDCSPITITACKGEEPLAITEIEPPIVNKTPDKKDRSIDSKPRPRFKRMKGDAAPKVKEQVGKDIAFDKQTPTKPKETLIIDVPKVEDVKEKEEEKETSTASKSTTKPIEKPVVKTAPKPVKKPKPQSPITMSQVDDASIAAGQIIRVNSLRFPANSTQLTESSNEVLDEVYDFLNRNQYITIEIGGHTNGIPSDEYCNKLSKARAEAVAQYLIDKGIHTDRVAAEGYGKTQPIADNETSAGRKRNQRVEVKIISTTGG